MIESRHRVEEVRLILRDARCSLGPRMTAQASIQIAGDRIIRIFNDRNPFPDVATEAADMNMKGFLVLPGFVNAHDHLQFALYPRMGNPPYRNYIEWGGDIHRTFASEIARQHAIPRAVRLWWGGIRNLLCGVTTVCHHDSLWPELEREDFPVRVVRKYGWRHSLALGGDLRQAYDATPAGRPFIVHACEGVDERARGELAGLDRLGVLDDRTVLVHGLAVDREGFDLIHERGTSLILCPTSNRFLYRQVPDPFLLSRIEKLGLGSDSPLTAEGDLLDEVRFAIRILGIQASAAYSMVTTASAAILRLGDTQGSIQESGVADLIAVRDTGRDPADRLDTLSTKDVELVIVGGRVHLAAEAMLERLPFAVRDGLEPLSVDGTVRWLRAPVRALMQAAEEVLGRGSVRLGGRKLLTPAGAMAEHVN